MNKKKLSLVLICVIFFLFVGFMFLIFSYAYKSSMGYEFQGFNLVSIIIPFVFIIIALGAILSKINKKNSSGGIYNRPSSFSEKSDDLFARERQNNPNHDEEKEDLFYHKEVCGEDMEACPNCKVLMPRTNLFCDSCGNLLRRECFVCGHINSKDEKKCVKCGSKL